MSNGPIPLMGDTWYAWGQGTDGQSLLLESTGLTVGGMTLFRLVPGASVGAELLVDDDSGEILFDDETGDVLYDG